MDGANPIANAQAIVAMARDDMQANHELPFHSLMGPITPIRFGCR